MIPPNGKCVLLGHGHPPSSADWTPSPTRSRSRWYRPCISYCPNRSKRHPEERHPGTSLPWAPPYPIALPKCAPTYPNFRHRWRSRNSFPERIPGQKRNRWADQVLSLTRNLNQSEGFGELRGFRDANVSAAGAKLLNSKFCVIYVLAREQMAFLYLYPRDTFAWQLWLQPQTCVPLSKKQISGRRAFSPVFWVRG